MERLSSFIGSKLEWVQPKALERRYELRAGDIVLASLAFRSAWGTLAIAETADGQWSFKRVGFLNPRVTVRRPGDDEDLAIYQPKFWGDGVLTLRDGRAFVWKPTNFWTTAFTFTNERGDIVAKFAHGVEKGRLSDIFKTQATAELSAGGECADLEPLLLTLGFYLLLLHQQDAGALAATTT